MAVFICNLIRSFTFAFKREVINSLVIVRFVSTSAVLGRNFLSGLSGELGKDVETVAVLDSDRVANPTEHLLLEWAMLKGEVTVGNLLEVLARPSLQRTDVIQTLRTQMSPSESPSV